MRNLPRFNDPNLVVGPEAFGDAGVYRLRDDLLIVQSLDFFPPLVDDPYQFGRIAAANALSDIYAMGGRPVTALNIVGFPDDQLPLQVLEEILRGGAERVECAGAVIAGGHTVRDAEVKYGLSVTGVVRPDELLTNRSARPGDVLLLTKALGTGFVTTAFKSGRCPPETLAAAVDSMTQLNQSASRAAVAAGARAATDVTGFGLAGHAAEMSQASGVTFVLDANRFPILPGVLDLARQDNKTRASATNRSFVEPMMRLEGQPDRLRLEVFFDAQTSGGLLLSVAADRGDSLLEDLRAAGVEAAAMVGSVAERRDVSLILRP